MLKNIEFCVSFKPVPFQNIFALLISSHAPVSPAAFTARSSPSPVCSVPSQNTIHNTAVHATVSATLFAVLNISVFPIIITF